jgi:hypothetical protein
MTFGFSKRRIAGNVTRPRAKGRADLAKKERRFDVVISPTDFILADLALRIL